MKPFAPIAAVALILAAAALVIGYRAFVGTPAHPITLAKADAMIRRDFPVGSSLAQVDEWLDRHGMGYDEPFAGPAALRDEYAAESGKYPISDLGGSIVEVVQDTDREPFVHGNLQFTFYFDKDGRLIDHRIHWLGTAT